MKTHNFRNAVRRWCLPMTAAVLVASASMYANATPPAYSDWVGTWFASPQPTWDGGPDSALPINIPLVFENQTIRQSARVSLGGSKIRIVLSNAYGKQPVTVGEVHVAIAGTGSAIVKGTDRVVTFGGDPTTVIAAGAPLVSDPVDLKVASLSNVSVSIYLPKRTPASTFHYDGRETAYIVDGNKVEADSLDTRQTTTARVILSGIQTERPEATGTVVAIGDSITDGHGATTDANARWPDYLAERLASHGVSVLNAGVSGGRLLRDRVGVNVLARFDRDVLSQPKLKAVVVLIGINDIGWPNTPFEEKDQEPSADDIIAGYQQLITRAHTRGVKVFGATLTPFEGALSGTPIAAYFDADKEQVRQAVNRWIRTSGQFDGIIDFDALARDPEHPTRLKASFDSGDHLHPGDEGNRAMANSVDLNRLLAR